MNGFYYWLILTTVLVSYLIYSNYKLQKQNEALITSLEEVCKMAQSILNVIASANLDNSKGSGEMAKVIELTDKLKRS